MGFGPVDGATAEWQDAATAIEIRRLSLRFQVDAPHPALDDVNLQIPTGAFVSLIGPSGCGKTSLLRIIADLEHPTSGEVRVAGLTPAEARRANRYGYVFQSPALLPWRNCRDNVRL